MKYEIPIGLNVFVMKSQYIFSENIFNIMCAGNIVL